MTTADFETTTRNAYLSRCDVPERLYDRFTYHDVMILHNIIDSAFCGIARVSDVVFKAKGTGRTIQQIRASLRKLDRHEIIFACQDAKTGAECVELLNVDGVSSGKGLDEMQALK